MGLVRSRELVAYVHSRTQSYKAIARIPERESEDHMKGLLKSIFRLVASVLCGASFIASRTRAKERSDWEEVEDSWCSCGFTHMFGLPDDLGSVAICTDDHSDDEDAKESAESCDGDFDL